MPQPYASGRHAIGLCDRCGRIRKLTDLKYQIINQINTNWLVCAEDCWEEDQPQYQIGRYPIEDPQALQYPRPDQRNDQEFGALLLEDGGFLVQTGGGEGSIIITTSDSLISH